MADAEHPVRRYRLQIEFDLAEKGERALGADQQMRHVVAAVGDHVDVVAADPAQEFREAPVDLVGLAAVQRAHVAHQVAIALGLDIHRHLAEIARHLGEARLGAVGEDRIDRADVVNHVAVADRARAAAVVRGHAADRRPVAGRDIDREPQLVLAQPLVEAFHDNAGLNLDAPGLGVEGDDRVHVLAAIEHQRARHGLAALRGAAAARQYRHALLAGDRQRRRDIVLVFRHGDPERLDLVDRRVGAVAPAAEPVEHDLAAQVAAQTGFEARQAGTASAGNIERHGFRSTMQGMV